MAESQSSTFSFLKCRACVLSLLGGVTLATLTVVSVASAANLYAPPVAYLPPPFS